MPKIYGEFATGLEGPIPGPTADQILGARASGQMVEVQFLSGKVPLQVTMALPQAMYLLSVLKAIQLDSGIKMPADPREP